MRIARAQPDAFAVTVNVGPVGKNLAITGGTGMVVGSAAGLPGVILGGLAATGSYMTAIRFENELWNRIHKEITRLQKK